MTDTTALQYLNPTTLAKPPGYTHVVVADGGKQIFISGQVALDAEGKLVGPGDLKAQAEQVFRNLQAALQSVGGDFGSVVKLTTFLVDIRGLPTFREVRDRFIAPGPTTPASSLVGVAALAGADYLIEIEAVAWLP